MNFVKVCTKVKASTSFYYKKMKIEGGKIEWVEEEKELPIKGELEFGGYEIDLFPKFKGSKAVEFTDRKSTEVSMATTTATKIAVQKKRGLRLPTKPATWWTAFT